MSTSTQLKSSLAFANWTAPTTIPSNTSTPNKAAGDDWEEAPLAEFRMIILPCIYAVVTIVGLIGNGIVVYIMQVKVRNKTITDVYVLNLGIADFIFVSMLPLWTVELAVDGWPFGGAMCKIASGCTYFDMYASVFFMTAMSVDRFLAVVLYQTVRRTKLCARAIVIAIWIFSSALGVLPMYFRGIVDREHDLPKCGWTFNNTIASDNSWFMVYTMTRSVIGFLIPLIIILVCYSAIIVFLKTRGTTGKLTEKRQDRATRMVLVIIGVFLVCWLPNQISNLFYVIDTLREVPSAPAHYYVHMFTTTLAWAHSCVNPILYAFMREDLRIKVTEIYYNLKKRCLCKKSRRRTQIRDTTEILVTPKTRRQLYCKGDENTQLLRLTQIGGTHKTSNESLAASSGTACSLNSDPPKEKESLLGQSLDTTGRNTEQSKHDDPCDERKASNTSEVQNNHVTDDNQQSGSLELVNNVTPLNQKDILL